jgi:hypothetical protein
MTAQSLGQLAGVAYIGLGAALAWWLRPTARASLRVAIAWPWAIVAHAWGKVRGQYPTWGPPL